MSEKCEVGDIVLWFAHADRSSVPFSAIVTQVNPETVCLNIFSPRLKNCQILDGVRHMLDPRAKQPELISQGGWEHTPRTRRLQDIERRLQPQQRREVPS